MYDKKRKNYLSGDGFYFGDNEQNFPRWEQKLNLNIPEAIILRP